MNKDRYTYEEAREEAEGKLSSLFGKLTKKVEFDEKDGERILRFVFKNGYVLEIRSVASLQVVHVKEEFFCWSGDSFSIAVTKNEEEAEDED